MVKKGILYAASTEKDRMICICYYSPSDDEKIKGVIQVVHGMTEYMERYEDFANYFVEQGYAVVGNDILGHGHSRSADNDPIYFEKWENPVNDILVTKNFINEKFPDVPVYLLGFSLGSFLCRSLKSTGIYKKKIFVGTGSQPTFVLKLMRGLVRISNPKSKEESALVKKLAFDNYDIYFKGEEHGSWLIRDAEIRKAYWADEKINAHFTAQFFIEFLRGMELLNKGEVIEDIPTAFVSGGKDPVGGQGKSVQKVFEKYKKICTVVSAIEVPEYGHDVLHDACKHDVWEKILDFIRR